MAVTEAAQTVLLTLGGHEVAITNPDRVLWPDDGITKGDLIAYYRAIAAVLLPHLAGRPLVMRPFPSGIAGKAYYRQSLPASAPLWMPRYRYVAKADQRPNSMPVVDDEASLVWLANQAAIEVHPWLSRIDRPDAPDYVVFDLDVMQAESFPLALEAGLLLRAELAGLGLRGYPKTTGGDGLHIYVPLARGPDYTATRAWAQGLALRLERQHPALITSVAGVTGRRQKVLVDYAQNSLGRTTVAPYSARPRPGAPVSTPLTWQEVEAGVVRPSDFVMGSVLQRVDAVGDLFRPVLVGGQSLPPGGNPPGRAVTAGGGARSRM